MDKRQTFISIAADLGRGELAFPTGARVAMKVRQALGHPDCHMDTAAKLVQAEPLLSARVVAMANSVVFNRSGREVTDVRSSVQRLGFSTVRALATALVTRQMAGSQMLESQQAVVAQLWEHTSHVASLAHVMARRVTLVDAETAMFAGIVHEVGGFYMLSRVNDFPGILDDDCAEWIESGEVAVGSAVLKVLAIPAAVMQAISVYWDGFLAIPPRTLGDTLLLAEELAPVSSPLHRLGGLDRREGMTASIEMSIGKETLTGILEESADEVASLNRALHF